MGKEPLNVEAEDLPLIVAALHEHYDVCAAAAEKVLEMCRDETIEERFVFKRKILDAFS